MLWQRLLFGTVMIALLLGLMTWALRRRLTATEL